MLWVMDCDRTQKAEMQKSLSAFTFTKKAAVFIMKINVSDVRIVRKILQSA